MTLPAGVVTFLFTDIEGSSAKWDKARPAMAEAVRRHDDILRAAIETHGGFVVKKMGDGVMAAFGDPADAVATALQAQRGLRHFEWAPPIDSIDVRVGIHTGPAEPRDADYLGPAPNRAARIEAAGHGGQILVSAATRELVGDRVGEAQFVDLGEHHLRGMSRPERIYQVTAEGLPESFAPLDTESTPTNLPALVKPVVGRLSELADLSAALDATRLLTVTGAGGAGKTTLAIEAARRRTGGHPGGVWLFELAALNDGQRIATEMLGAMRRPAPGDADPREVLTAALSPERALLVIDNCEHLLADVAELVASILRRAPDVTVLATSREPLGVGGERVWTIPTMSFPAGATPDAVASSDSGALFAARARAADPSFQLTEDNAATLADICRRLDGLPLAIELAAARLRSMGLTDLDRRLEDRFKLLRGGDRDAASHHQTLRDTVAWSYDLLSSEEQRLYRCLAVFAGGFDLDAAEAVEGGDRDLIDELDHLVAQSLVVAELGDQTRYRMLETIRQFGAERLDESGERDGAARAHLEWVQSLVKQGARELEGRNQGVWLKRFRTEIDNIRTALTWAKDHDPVTGAGLVSALSRFFWMYNAEGDARAMKDATSFLREGYDWAVTMLGAAGDAIPDKLRARLQLSTGGLLCVRLGRYDEALTRLAEAAEIFGSEGDTRSVGWATFYRGIAGFGIVGRDETVSVFEASLEMHTAAEDEFGMLMSRLLYSFCVGFDDPAAGRKAFEPFNRAAQGAGVPFITAHAADWNAVFDATEGIVTPETRRNAAEALATFRRVNNYGCISHALGSAAAVLATGGDFDGAARTMGVADATRRRLSMVVAPYEDREAWVRKVAGDAVVDGPDWAAARAEGLTFEPDEGIDWAIERLGFDPQALVD